LGRGDNKPYVTTIGDSHHGGGDGRKKKWATINRTKEVFIRPIKRNSESQGSSPSEGHQGRKKGGDRNGRWQRNEKEKMEKKKCFKTKKT